MAETSAVGLSDLLDALRHRWKIAGVIFLGILVGAGLYAYSLPKQYTAKAVVALTPRPQSGATASDVAQLGQKYVAYVNAPTTAGTIAPRFGLTRGTLGDAVSADIATGSVDLGIKVTLRDPANARDAANAFASAVVTFSDSDRLLVGQVVSPAVTPTSPSKPRRKLITGAGGLIALIIATAIAVIIERGRPRVRSAGEVAYVTGHGVLGRVPTSRAVRGGVRESLADPLVGGAIRSLRTVLDHQARDAAIRTLAVTSSIPGEGKTTMAASLAWAIAHLDARVLLIDGDLRHPSVGRLFGLPHGPGLVELLRGEARLAEAVRPVVGAAGLSVLTTSGLAETGDLLARSMHAVLNAATAQYDVVIIDTPPLLAGDDAGTIATMSDAVLLVVSNGVEIRRLGEAARILDAIQARVIGVLLNRTEVPSYGYTYRNLGGRSSQSSGGTTAAAS